MTEFQALLNALPSPAALLDARGVVTLSNARWRQRTSLPSAGARFEPNQLLHTCEDGQSAQTALEQMLDGALDRWTWSCRGDDGALYRWDLSVVEGEPRRVLVLQEEVAQAAPHEALHAVNRELHEAKLRQRGILDSIPDIAWLKDPQGRFLAVNEPFGRAAGLSPEEIVGRTDLDLFVTELAERYRADDREVMAQRTLKRVEEPFVDHHGRRTWIETIKVPIQDDQGVLIGTAGIARDITERKLAETQLRSSHAELQRQVAETSEELRRTSLARAVDAAERRSIEETRQQLVDILEATTDFVGMADTTGQIFYLNRAGRRLLGLQPNEDVAQHTIAEFHPPWAMRVLRDQVFPAAQRDGAWSGELAFLNREGREVPVSMVVLNHRNEGGETTFFSTVARDVSPQRRMEAQLLQAQKMEGIGRLAGGIAHDFNNLLTAMLGYVEFARVSLPQAAGAEPLTYLQQAEAAVLRAADLTKQLLAFARKEVVQPKVVDLNLLIPDAHGILRRLIGEDVELVTLLDGQPCAVKVDPGQFHQILINLAVNARDAMPQGGRLVIQTEQVDVGEHNALEHPGLWGPHALVTVSDTGSGMAPEVLAHIFEPFFTTKPDGRGTGLGLATCYGIVQQAGGHILVDSAPEEGARFRIYLPLTNEPIQGVDAPSTAAPRGGRETIVVVEDEPLIRGLVVKTLRSHGYQVLVAENGSEALTVAAEHAGPIHLLLTDVVMPHMGGKQLAARLHLTHPELPVLFMSGYVDTTLAHDGVLEKGVVLLHKPFTPQTLVMRVREVLDRAAAPRTTVPGPLTPA